MDITPLRFVRHLVRDRAAATAAEFALVIPLLLLFIFGIIDVGRLMWDWNQAQKATQIGVRFAVVTDFVPTGLAEHDFTDDGVTQGAAVDDALFPGVSCTGTDAAATCTCVEADGCDFDDDSDHVPFNNIVDRMSEIYGAITPENVVVDYEPSGLGFAGNPYGADVAPTVTVRLQGLEFQPLMTQLFGVTFDMAGFASSMTMEDGAGSASN